MSYAVQCATRLLILLLEDSMLRLNDAAAAGPVEEELFENERVSPFKGGWGHDWPGHFLPTDKVGHWSIREGTPAGSNSMNFSSVAPKLPKVQVVPYITTASHLADWVVCAPSSVRDVIDKLL